LTREATYNSFNETTDLGTVVGGAVCNDDIRKVMPVAAAEAPLDLISIGKRR
jgi:hypothetical protein